MLGNAAVESFFAALNSEMSVIPTDRQGHDLSIELETAQRSWRSPTGDYPANHAVRPPGELIRGAN